MKEKNFLNFQKGLTEEQKAKLREQLRKGRK